MATSKDKLTVRPFFLIVVVGLSSVYGSFEASGASEALGASAAAAGPSVLKSIWEMFGNSAGSLGSGDSAASVTDQLGSARNRDPYNSRPYSGDSGRGNYPDYNSRGPTSYPESPNGQRGREDYPEYPRAGGNSPTDWSRSGGAVNQRLNTAPVRAHNGAGMTGGVAAAAVAPRQSSERSGRNRFPDPMRIFDDAQRPTTVMLRVAPVLSQSTRNTPYEIVESLFHGPWSWDYVAQHVYALHWDLEYRFDSFGDTVYTFGSRKESDGKLWGSLDKRAFTEMPAKYFFLGNITTSPKAATQTAYDNPLNGQTYDIMSVNCQAWAIQHCKDMSEDLYIKMKDFPTLLESTN